MKKLSSLTIFFPFWNEEANVEKVVTAAIPVAHEVAEKWEILIIDDGSTDKTKKVAEAMEKKHHDVRLLSHNTNRGYGAALKSGFENAQYEYIVFADGDLQFDFAEVAHFIEAMEKDNVDIVIGYRKKRNDSNLMVRLLLMYMLKVWDFILFHFYVKDIDCGFKMFKRDAIQELMPLRSEGAMITTELLAKAKVKNLRLAQVGVNHYPRKHGEQSGANASVIIRAVFESLILWWDIRNKRF